MVGYDISKKILYSLIFFIFITFTVSSCGDSGDKAELDKYANILFGIGNTSTTTSPKGVVFSRYTIYSDDNNDGIVNKGETIQIKVYLKNTGTSQANNVYATLSTSSPYVTLTTYGGVTEAWYGTIYSGKESTQGESYNASSGRVQDSWYSYEFKVSLDTPASTVINFTLTATDDKGNTWTSNFSITVQQIAANIQFSRYTIYYDTNGNGIVNANETIRLKVYLKNTGTSQANNVYATLSTSSPYVTLTTYGGVTEAWYGTIYSGKESTQGESYNASSGRVQDSWYSYEFKVGSAPSSTVLNFTLNINDTFNNTWVSSFNITVQ